MMKKEYVKPEAEKIEFDYRTQVVASGTGGSGQASYTNQGASEGCKIAFVSGCALWG